MATINENSSQEEKRLYYSSIIENFRKKFNLNHNIDYIAHFNPYHFYLNDYEPLVKGLPVVFITTPRLNLSKNVNMNKLAFFKYMSDSEPELLSLLNFGGNNDVFGTGSPFIKLLTNNFKNINIQGVQARTKEYYETFYGYKQLFPTAMIDSISGNEISLTFFEDKNLSVVKLHKVWTDYIEYIRRGVIKPAQDTLEKRFIDFTCSIYYFLLDFDFETILYYSKYTGCAPMNVPYDVFSGELSGDRSIVELPFSYVYSYKEDMNPDILMDFNILAGSAGLLSNNDYVSKIMYSSNASEENSSTNANDSYENKNYTNINSAFVVLENYTDNESKRRYKLKFSETAPTQSTLYQEYPVEN